MMGRSETSHVNSPSIGEPDCMIHRPNGQIRDKDSYGNDPNPPKDTKH